MSGQCTHHCRFFCPHYMGDWACYFHFLFLNSPACPMGVAWQIELHYGRPHCPTLHSTHSHIKRSWGRLPACLPASSLSSQPARRLRCPSGLLQPRAIERCVALLMLSSALTMTTATTERARPVVGSLKKAPDLIRRIGHP